MAATPDNVWLRLTRALWVLVALAIAILIGLCYLPLIRQNESLHKELMRLDQALQQQSEVLARKRLTVQALQTDPKTIERLAREKLGLARPGETVLYFEPTTNGAPKR